MIVDNNLERRNVLKKSFEEQVHGRQKLTAATSGAYRLPNSLLQGSKKFYFIDRVSSDLH